MSKLLEQILKLLKLIGLMWVKQVIFTICLIGASGILMIMYLGWDARFMSNRELLATLEQHYDREFTLISSRSLQENERAEGVWRVKVFELAPSDAPEQQFWAYNIVSSESGGIFGASNGLRDTYDVQIMVAAFEERAARAGLDYELTYYSYPCQETTDYYSEIYVNIELAGWDNLAEMCELAAAAASDALAQLPPGYEYSIGVDFVFIYREPDWPADKFYPLRVTPYDYKAEEPMSAADMQAEIASEFDWYTENYDVWKKLNK